MANYAPVLMSSPCAYLFPDGTLATNLKKYGFLPVKSAYSTADRVQYTLKDHQFTKLLEPFERRVSFANKYAGTVPSSANLTLNIKKLDVRPSYNFEKNSKFPLAMSFVEWFDAASLAADIQDLSVVKESANRKAAAGFPECLFYKDKGECIDSDMFWEVYNDESCASHPFFKYSPKIEWKELAEIMANKIRGFAVGSARMVFKQREYFGSISEKMKMTKWSYHGFNPFGGGTTRLVEYLGWKRRWLRWDTSGWDRLFPLMKHVGRIWRSKLRVPESKRAEFNDLFGPGGKYTMEFFYYIMPDGSVVLMEYSNPQWPRPHN